MQVKVDGRTVWLNFHHLYYFFTIANQGGISEASKKLGVGQPALSAQLKQFETALNAKLFERQGRRLALTETGRMVLEYAQDIFRMGSELIEVIQDRAVPHRSHLQIGVLDSIPKHITLELTKAALSSGPCSITVLEGQTDELIRELANHRIDLFISNFVPTQNDLPGLFSRKITRAPILVCGAPSFRRLKKGFPHSLKKAPMILPTTHSKLRHDIEHFFRVTGIEIDIVAEVQDTATQKLLGLHGIGLVPAPLPAVSEYLQKKEFIEIGRLEGVEEHIFMVSASRKIENPISAKLMRSFQVET
jgi:LysR family transcriptional activator of nhaA